MRKIGAVTIGQSPRNDIIPEIAALLGRDIEIAEAGALDGLSGDQIAALAPRNGDNVLVSRLADGSSVTLSERLIVPIVLDKIAAMFAGRIPVIAILCTGEFPCIPGGLLLLPQKILFNAVASVAAGLRLGVLVPTTEQAAESDRYWKNTGAADVLSVAASPYDDAENAAKIAAMELKSWGVDVMVLDCMGYGERIKRAVCDLTGTPAILARSVTARLLAELAV